MDFWLWMPFEFQIVPCKCFAKFCNMHLLYNFHLPDFDEYT